MRGCSMLRHVPPAHDLVHLYHTYVMIRAAGFGAGSVRVPSLARERHSSRFAIADRPRARPPVSASERPGQAVERAQGVYSNRVSRDSR